jgi:RimJ/RimL family protein N-acetyltransferase
MLRDVTDSDLPIFFEHQLDADANQMAAFAAENPSDRAVFDAHWARIMADPDIITKTIIFEGNVAGYVASFTMFNQLQVAYWIGTAFWGKGIASRALTAFLKVQTTRPLYGRAAKDNLGSIRVLEKCGFVLTDTERAFANARGQEIDEVILVLE